MIAYAVGVGAEMARNRVPELIADRLSTRSTTGPLDGGPGVEGIEAMQA
jgi:hypothetical protein